MGEIRRHTGDAANGLGLALQISEPAEGRQFADPRWHYSVGLAAAAIAKKFGARVASTTRNSARVDLLRSAGAESVFVDTGTIAGDGSQISPDGFDKVLELIGVTTLADSLRLREGARNRVHDRPGRKQMVVRQL